MLYKRVRPSAVRLDPQNPRLPDGTDNDREAVNRLLEENATGLLNLARDLADSGEANPTELPIVVKDGTKWLALEGNRRFAALKLLANPSLADDAKHRVTAKRLADRGSPPKTVYCAVFESRESADKWLVLRHTGANDGVGVRGWDAQQTARHRQRAKKPVDSGTARSLTIADELEEAYALHNDLLALVRRVRKQRLTNIGRLFSPDVLTRVGLAVRIGSDMHARDSILLSRLSAQQMREFFDWAFTVLDTETVDKFRNSDIRRQLLDEAGEVVPNASGLDGAPATRLADRPWSPADGGSSTDEDDESGWSGGAGTDGAEESGAPGDGGGSGEGGSDAGAGGTGTGTGGSGNSRGKGEARPEKRLFQGLKLPNVSGRTQALLKEARQVEHDIAPGIACVLARVLVELAVSNTKVMAWSGATEAQSLGDKVRACLAALDPKYQKSRVNRPELTPAALEVSTGEYGVKQMHQFMHNPVARPDPHHARRLSSVWRPFLEAVDERTGQEGS